MHYQVELLVPVKLAVQAQVHETAKRKAVEWAAAQYESLTDPKRITVTSTEVIQS